MSELTTETTTTHTERHGASEGTYFAIFVLLAVLTLIELVATYLPIVKVPLLLGLACGKAWLVVQFYMHLRYDSRILTWTFIVPVIIGVIATLLLQPLITTYYF
jgi:cytochrome c oxidase subunit 4